MLIYKSFRIDTMSQQISIVRSFKQPLCMSCKALYLAYGKQTPFIKVHDSDSSDLFAESDEKLGAISWAYF